MDRHRLRLRTVTSSIIRVLNMEVQSTLWTSRVGRSRIVDLSQIVRMKRQRIYICRTPSIFSKFKIAHSQERTTQRCSAYGRVCP